MTIAIIKTGGKQYLVSEGQKLKIEKLNRQEGDEFEFDRVLLFANSSTSPSAMSSGPNGSPQVKIGQPYLQDTKVRARVLKEGRGEKKIVFRYKNKTRYKKKKGHRQAYTEIQVLEITS